MVDIDFLKDDLLEKLKDLRNMRKLKKYKIKRND